MEEKKRWAEAHPICAKWHERGLDVFACDGASHGTRVCSPPRPYIVRAEGALKFDEDGKVYVDWVMGHGALLLGHSHPRVVEAVQKQAALGLHYGDNHRVEVEWAEQVKKLMPRAERVEPCACGQEANLIAIRVARAHTGRAKVLRIEECFHGWADQVTLDPRWRTPNTTFVPFGDLDAVKRELATREYAVVFVEGSGAHMGQIPLVPEFYRAVGEAARANGTVFVLDEVVTGFRPAPGGFQSVAGVEPDLFTIGKIAGGGLAIGACCGPQSLMGRIKEFRHTGTWNGTPLPCAAGLATLRVIDETHGQPQRDAAAAAQTLCKEFSAAIAARGLSDCAATYVRAGSIVHTYFGPRERPVASDDGLTPPTAKAELVVSRECGGRQERLGALLLERSVSTMNGRLFIASAAHTAKDVADTVAAFASSLDVMAAEGLLTRAATVSTK